MAGAMLTAFMISICLHAQEFKVGSKTVQVHGFGTQGFIRTNDNNWLTMNTSGDGSGAFTDFGLNMGMQINPQLHIGGQFYDRKLGKLGDWEPLMDWAMLDYRPRPWLGFRVGKVKTVLGLFTDSQDMDFNNTFALLPQSVYPIDLRDASISHEGGDIYGKERLPHKLGSIAYTAYGGRRADNMHSGYPYLLTGLAGITLTSYGGPVFGGDFRWNPPVRGLTVRPAWDSCSAQLSGKLETRLDQSVLRSSGEGKVSRRVGVSPLPARSDHLQRYYLGRNRCPRLVRGRRLHGRQVA
jgi:hypothetical protein